MYCNTGIGTGKVTVRLRRTEYCTRTVQVLEYCTTYHNCRLSTVDTSHRRTTHSTQSQAHLLLVQYRVYLYAYYDSVTGTRIYIPGRLDYLLGTILVLTWLTVAYRYIPLYRFTCTRTYRYRHIPYSYTRTRTGYGTCTCTGTCTSTAPY